MHEQKQQTNSYLEDEEFLSLSFPSKKEFSKQYKRIYQGKPRAKKFYFVVLAELEEAILNDNVASFKHLSKLCDYIRDIESPKLLKTIYNDEENPIGVINLLILVCKHNRIEILKYIFSNGKIFENLSIFTGKDAMVPDDKDETSHDVFYYAIRSGNIEVLDLLISKWPGNYFVSRQLELDEVLSRAYEQLKLQNVSLSDEMEIFVQRKLIDVRFFSNPSGQVQSSKDSLHCIRQRMDLVLENITLLKSEYSNDEKVDAKFLFVGRFIAQNIYILKRQLKLTYDRLPWEEMEFCLVALMSSYLKKQEMNLFYRAILNKSKILLYLENFAKKLSDIKPFVTSLDVSKLAELPKLNRETVVANIIRDDPQFLDLYNDYQKIRDIHSLERVSYYVNMALSIDPKEQEGQIIITRALQVIGEYFKNTLESPKLSSTTSELLLLSLPKSTRKVIIDLRNSISHAYLLLKRTKIYENADADFFIGIQNDIKRIENVIADILFNNSIKMIEVMLKKIINSQCIDEIRTIGEVMSSVKLEKVISHDFEMAELSKIEKLIQQLSDAITEKTNFEKELFNKINHIISSEKVKSENIRADYKLTLIMLTCLCMDLSHRNLNGNSVKVLKYSATKILENFIPRVESKNLKEIIELSMMISSSASFRNQDDTLDTIDRLGMEIFYIAEFEINDMKWVEKLRKKLREKGSSLLQSKQSTTSNITEDEYNKLLEDKLSELKNILMKDPASDKLIDYKKNTKLQVILEMLVLDIMSILGRSEKYLENNLLFLDDNIPLLIGKSLRNHLAHGNILLYVLLADPSLAVVLNAEKLVAENIIQNNKKVGKMIEDDPSKLNLKFGQDLNTIIDLEDMFAALVNGSLEELERYLKKGSDINAKSINSSTLLHFAAQGPNLNLIKFIIDQNLPSNGKDENGQTPLHVAAAYGRESVVKFFLTQGTIPVDEPDKLAKTPLHLAAINGQKDTVEILLRNNANTNAIDFSGNSPLHYAVRNNHIEVVKILLKQEENVDINETKGGFRSLHIAAEFGCLEVVNFLLENGAEVNAKTDRNAIPLHTASLNGHLEVVIALILKGAEVNAKVLDGCTSLHYAAERRHEKVGGVLLKYGAEIDATDKTYNNTPLHYSARFGHEEMVEIFLKNSANVNIATKAGITPLHYAVESGHLKVVTSLLKHGSNIYARDIRNYSVLHYAAANGHEKVTEFLIQNGAAVNAKGFDNITPLHLAASKGYSHIINLLIKNEAEVNHGDFRGNTPLMAAAENGHKGVIEILLKNKAKVNSRSFDGHTPLHVTAFGGYYDISILLLDHAADVNAKDDVGHTPLYAAISNGHKEIVTLFIKNQAQVDTVDVSGKTPLNTAVEANRKEIVEILISNGAKIDSISNNSLPLSLAIRNNNKELVGILLANGANVDAEQGHALSLAVLSGYQDIVELLLKNHAHVNIKGPDGGTPLYLAAERGHIEIVNALISRGADVNALTSSASPLSVAARSGHSEVAEILLVNGANVDIGNPLHEAAAKGHVNVVSVLLSNGAKIDTKDYKGRTALELAVANGHLPVVKVFMQHEKVNLETKGNNGLTLLLISAQQDNLQLVKYLVDNGSNVDAKSDTGLKCIHISAREGSLDAVEFFLAKGMNVNEPSAIDQTPLHYATMKNQVEVVKYLISKGANVNAKDNQGFTSMHMAAIFGFKDIIKVLFKKGAFFNTVDNCHRTPLKIAKEENIVVNDIYLNTPCNLNDKKDVIKLLSSTKSLFDSVKNNSASEVEEFIKAGAFIDAKHTEMEATPLHYAAWKGYADIVDILLQNRADPDSKCNKGFTALHYAAQFSHSKCVKILLCHGATYNVVSETGKTPVALTNDKGIIDLFKMIDDLFKKIRNNNPRVIQDLNEVNERDLKPIMNARNRENQSIITAASQRNYELADKLKFISQSDVPIQLSEAAQLLNQGCYQRSLSIFKRLVERRKQLLGPDNPATLDMQTYVAKALYKQGDYQKSLDMLEGILDKQKDILGLDSKDTLDTRSAIALVLHRLDKNDEALDIYKEVYKKQTKILPLNDENIVNTQFHMALVLNALGKHEDALNINQVIFKMREKTLGKRHMNTIMAQNNIAMVLTSQGKFEEALKVYKEVLDKKKEIVGINHADTLRTMQSIATILVNQNNLQEGLKAYEEVLNIQKKTLQQNHPEILNTQYHIGNVLFTQGKYISSFKVYKECYDQRRDIFGPNHFSVVEVQEKLKLIMDYKFKIDGNKLEEILQHLQKEINIACSNGDIRTVEHQLQNGADVNDADIDGRTPLHFAVNNGHLALVNILLKNGADVTLVTNKGNTPLHTAVSKNYEEIAQVLLQHVNLNKLHDFVNAKTTSGGMTSLHIAAKWGYLKILKLLLTNGAVYDIPNKEGKIPVDLVSDREIMKLFELIEQVFKLVKRGGNEAIDKLKTMKPDEFKVVTNARSSQGHGLLQVAIVNKHKNIAGALLAMLKKQN